MVSLLTESGRVQVDAAECAGEDLWLFRADVERATGWSLRPEGLCRDDVCVPVPAALQRPDAVNVAGLWRHRGGPVVHDDDRETWVLGEPAAARGERLRGLEAPDFTLPDLEGNPHSLRDYRGRKVLLVTWASW